MALVQIPIGLSAYRRFNLRQPEIALVNRYFEKDPMNPIDGVSLNLRPALRRLIEIGDGPIRLIAFRKGVQNNRVFVVSGNSIYALTRTSSLTFSSVQLTATIAGTARPSMDFTAPIGTTPGHIFVTDRQTLQYSDGTTAFQPIATPNNVPIAKVAYVSGYVVCTVADESGMFYWIEPGETTIDPLNFATAEGAPDPIVDLTAVGDQFFLSGNESIEIWYFTGDLAAPANRLQGKLFNRGVVPETMYRGRNSDAPIFVGADGGVYLYNEGFTRISTPGVEERIREAIQAQISVNIQGA